MASKSVVLPVMRREKVGSAQSRRYRRQGRIPCVLYGGGQASVPLTLDKTEFGGAMKSHARVVTLRLGEEEQTALIREIGWDVFGEHVEHVDFVRVDLAQLVEVDVLLRFVGTAAGIGQGGTLQALFTDLGVRCRADSIPDEIRIDVSALAIGQGLHVRDIVFPEGVVATRDANDLVVHVVEPVKEEVAAVPEAVPGVAAPEVAGAAATPAAGAPAPAAAKGGEKSPPAKGGEKKG